MNAISEASKQSLNSSPHNNGITYQTDGSTAYVGTAQCSIFVLLLFCFYDLDMILDECKDLKRQRCVALFLNPHQNPF